MQKIVIFFQAALACLIFSSISSAKVLEGNVNKEDFIGSTYTVIDSATGRPVQNAKISAPSKGFFSKTNNSGAFKFNGSGDSPFILSVDADGYKPFSLTINQNNSGKPLVLSLEKLSGKEIVIDSQIRHLGDNKFSYKSANSSDFKLKARGSSFSKDFFVGNLNNNANPIIKIGSIIGLDTETAKESGQSKVSISSSTPAKIFLNSKKIAEIDLNGDEQEFYLPKNVLKQNSKNTIKIKTGVNKESEASVDYDDIEFMNLILVLK
jgi:hypothetical protein